MNLEKNLTIYVGIWGGGVVVYLTLSHVAQDTIDIGLTDTLSLSLSLPPSLPVDIVFCKISPDVKLVFIPRISPSWSRSRVLFMLLNSVLWASFVFCFVVCL